MPKIEIKQYLSQWYKSSYMRTHEWSEPQDVFIKGPTDVKFTQTCSRCGAIKTRVAFIAQANEKYEHFGVFDGIIHYPPNYKDSECYKRRKRAWFRKKTRTYYEIEEDKRREKIELEKQMKREKQIALNIKIIKEIKSQIGRKSRFDILRRDLAIYRLYRYSNLKFGEIRAYTHFNKDYVKTIIGRTFRKLCLASESCSFRQIFLENKEKEKKEEVK